MRVRDLRHLLGELRDLFSAGAARAQEAAISRVAAAMEPHDDAPLDSYLKKVAESGIERMTPKASVYAQRLLNARLDEEQFLQAFNDLTKDKTLKKSDVQVVAEKYVGSYDKRAAVPKLLDSIKSEFYTKLYERDAREIAKRARPI
jgi:hypothetical protein